MADKMVNSCLTCRYFYPVVDTSGLCKRYPPQGALLSPSSPSAGQSYWGQPEVGGDDWCGEFKPATVSKTKPKA